MMDDIIAGIMRGMIPLQPSGFVGLRSLQGPVRDPLQ
jgi:hypothetical protein